MSFFFLIACRIPAPTPSAPPPALAPEVSLRIQATPGDSVISFHDFPEAVGTLDLEGLPPGTYPLQVARPGHQTIQRLVPLSEDSGDLSLALEPLPQPVEISVSPADAAWTLSRGEDILAEGTGAWSGELLAGPLSLRVTREGREPRAAERYLEGPLSWPVWLDREGQIVEKVLEFKSGHHPKGLRFSPDGAEIWASFLGGPPSVAGYSATTGAELHELTLGKNGAVEVIYSPDGAKVYASQMETASVYEIDRASGTVLRQLDTLATWSKIMHLSTDGTRMYVSNWVSSDITELDLASGEVLRELDTVDTPRGLWIDPTEQQLYVLGFGNGKMERIDLETGARQEVFSAGGALRHVVGDVERRRLYISDMSKGTVWLYDLKTGRTSRLAGTDPNPNTIDLTPDGRLLFVSCRGQNNRESYYKPGPQWGSVLVFDALTGQKLDAIVAGNQPTALDVSDDGRFVAYSDMLDDRISVYRIPPYAVFADGDGGRSAVYKRELWKGRR